jgi:hypothetical protein
LKIKRCGKCGFSLALSRVIRINDNGTITGRFDENFRISLIESDFLTGIFRRIEEELGLPIMHLVFEAQRNASTEVINVFLKGIRGMARWTTLGKKFVVSMFCRLAVWTGQGYAETITYKSGKLGEAIVRNPFNRELMAAVIVGAFESLERQPFGYSWKKLGDDDLISIHPEPSRPEIAERMTFKTNPMKPGWRTYCRCPKCGVPLDFEFAWDENEGIVMDKRLGVRMVFLDAYTPKVVFRELARELGEAIYPIIIDAQRDLSLRHLRQELLGGGDVGEVLDKEAFYLSVLDTLAMRGQGNPVEHSFQEESLRVIIENPFNPHLLAGHLSGMYELGEGRPAVVTWKDMDPSTLEFTLIPA